MVMLIGKSVLHRGLLDTDTLFLIYPASWGSQEALTTPRVQVPDRQQMRHQMMMMKSPNITPLCYLNLDSQMSFGTNRFILRHFGIVAQLSRFRRTARDEQQRL